METMILVAGLAVAGLVGIAAAFYFSMRTGNSGYRRSSRRSAEAGRAQADGHQGSRGSAAADDWAANGGRAATHASRNYRGEAHTGPNTVMDFGQDPGLVGGPAPAAAGRRAQAEVPTVALPAFNGRPDEAPGEEWLGSNGDPRPLGAAPLGAPTSLDAFGSAPARPGRRPATR